MSTLRANPCPCGHARRQHAPEGCSECDCTERAPRLVQRSDGTEVETWGSYSNRAPSFEPGNTAAVRHGATSPRLVSERSQRMLAELVETMPWLADADAVAVEALARAKAVFDPLDEYVMAVISGDQEAHPRRGAPKTGVEAVPDHVWRQWRGCLKLIIEAAGALGMTPVSRAALFKDAGWARHLAGQDRIETMVARGREELARRRDQGPTP